ASCRVTTSRSTVERPLPELRVAFRAGELRPFPLEGGLSGAATLRVLASCVDQRFAFLNLTPGGVCWTGGREGWTEKEREREIERERKKKRVFEREGKERDRS
ncbi:hypothetical protein EGW08_003209, partial [Elysia chlorotica]